MRLLPLLSLVVLLGVLLYIRYPNISSNKIIHSLVEKPGQNQTEAKATIPMYARSAYILPNNDLRVMVIQHCDDNQAIYLQNGSKPINMSREPVIGCPWDYMPKCVFSGYILHAKLPENFDTKKILMWRNPKEQITLEPMLVEAKKERLDFAFCISPAYFYVDWVQLVYFVEIWMQLGVQKFYFYVHSLAPEVKEIADMYVKDGIMELISWPALPTKEHNEAIYLAEQMLAINDCLLRSRSEAKFVSFNDLDEIMAVYTGETLVQFIKRVAESHPRAGAFVFRMTQVQLNLLPIYRDAATINAEKLNLSFLGALTHDKIIQSKSKLIVKPETIKRIFIHQVKEYESSSTNAYEVKITEALVLHVRRVEATVYRAVSNESVPEESLYNHSIRATQSWQNRVNKHYPSGLSLRFRGVNAMDELEACQKALYDNVSNVCTAVNICENEPTVSGIKWVTLENKWIMF